MNTTHTQVLDCGHEPTPTSGTPTSGLGTGVAYNSDNDTMCYHCAYLDIMDDIVMAGISLRNDQADFRLPIVYMSSDGKTVTTWDGQFIGHVTHHGDDHPWTIRYKDPMQRRHYIDVKITYGADVVNAYGVGAPGEYCVLRRRKSDTVRDAA